MTLGTYPKPAPSRRTACTTQHRNVGSRGCGLVGPYFHACERGTQLNMNRVLILLLASCCPAAPSQMAPAAPGSKPSDPLESRPLTTTTLAAIGLDSEALDRTADPCDDFYQFACGNWIAKTEIPTDKPSAMRSFVAITDRNLEYERNVLEQARTTPGNDAVLQTLGTYYGSCMDEAAIDRIGLRAVAPLLTAANSVKDMPSLAVAVGTLHAFGVQALFELGPAQDSADARNVIANIDQGGIGLPDRDYYLKDDDQSAKIRNAYRNYVAQMLVDAGRSKTAATAAAAAIVALETDIAKVSKDKVARRDPKGTYNKIDRDGVAKAMSHFDWNRFWSRVGLPDVRSITVTSPEFLVGVDALVARTPIAVWRDYLTASVLCATAAYISTAMEKQRFEFSSVLTGTPQQEPRWKRCAQQTNRALGDLLGQVFVRDRFAGTSKAGAEQEVRAIVAAMTKNLADLQWMDATTKAHALTKLQAMTYQIGYPKKWRSYPFPLDPKTWGANALAANAAERARQLAKIEKPVDRDDWDISTPTVNAYYDPQLNGMVFPAGILQPPFFSTDASIAVNFGGIGVIVGHEITHGFDDQGAQYDAQGNLKDWWQPKTQQQFVDRTRCVIDQYSKYQIAGGAAINGANTVGENIADIGGVKLALAGYRALRSGARNQTVADGFSEDQQFFLGFGQSWCAKVRPDYEKLLSTVDVHSPPRWRVNGSLAATPEFAKAFHCKAGAKMAPASPCVVW